MEARYNLVIVLVAALASAGNAAAHQGQQPTASAGPILVGAGASTCATSGIADCASVRCYYGEAELFFTTPGYQLGIWIDQNADGRADRAAHADDPATPGNEAHPADTRIVDVAQPAYEGELYAPAPTC